MGSVVRMRTLVLCVVALGCAPNGSEQDGTLISFEPPNVRTEPGTLFRGSFSPDGSEFYYFVKVAEEGEDYRVYQTRRLGSGWSAPDLLPLGDPNASTMYPVVSPDGRLLVFSTYRPVASDAQNANLWAAPRSGLGWGEPVPLTEASTPENYDAGPWFGPEGELRFSSTSPDWSQTWARKAPRLGEAYGSWSEDTFWDELDFPRETHHFWSGVLNQEGTIAVIELSERQADGSLGDSDLWMTRRISGTWSRAEPLEQGVNTERTENFATFAPDGSTLVFVRDFTEFHSVVLSR